MTAIVVAMPGPVFSSHPLIAELVEGLAKIIQFHLAIAVEIGLSQKRRQFGRNFIHAQIAVTVGIECSQAVEHFSKELPIGTRWHRTCSGGAAAPGACALPGTLFCCGGGVEAASNSSRKPAVVIRIGDTQ